MAIPAIVAKVAEFVSEVEKKEQESNLEKDEVNYYSKEIGKDELKSLKDELGKDEIAKLPKELTSANINQLTSKKEMAFGKKPSDLKNELSPEQGNDIPDKEKKIEVDDKGRGYKVDGEIVPNTEYTINNITYKTDSLGRKESWQGKPEYNPEAERDEGAQLEAGGEDRLPGDDGMHIEARILNGSPGNENIVPVRGTINRGDYKRSENEIVKAKIEGKEVLDSGKIRYEGDSKRPSQIERIYTIDGETKVLTIDNNEGSKALLEDIKKSVSEESYDDFLERISDIEEDGGRVSITSEYKEFDKNGNLLATTVGFRDETSGEKSYKKYYNDGGTR